MKRLLVVGLLAATMFALVPAVPASAHIEHGMNCHINSVRFQVGRRVVIRMRITNRTKPTQVLWCYARINTTLRDKNVYFRARVPTRRYKVVRGVFRYSGTFRFARITHGHS